MSVTRATGLVKDDLRPSVSVPLYTQAAIVENTWAATYTSNGVTLVIGKD